MSKEQKNSILGFFMVLVSLFLLINILMIPEKGTILQSARLMPMIVVVFMLAISCIYFINNVRKGIPSFKEICSSVRGAVKEQEWKNTFFAIGIVALYVFVGVPYIGYYISSFLLIGFVLLFMLRRLKKRYAVIALVVITALLYLIFAVAFKIRLR